MHNLLSAKMEDWRGRRCSVTFNPWCVATVDAEHVMAVFSIASSPIPMYTISFPSSQAPVDLERRTPSLVNFATF